MSGLEVRNRILFFNDRTIPCNTENYVPVVVPGLPSGSSCSSVALPTTTSSSQELKARGIYAETSKKKIEHTIEDRLEETRSSLFDANETDNSAR